MMMRNLCLFSLATIFIAACNDDTARTPILRSQSQVLLQTPPETYSAGVFGFGLWSWETHEGVARVTFYPSSTQLGDEFSIDVPGVTAMVADTLLKDDTWYFLVGTIDQSEAFSLYRYRDDDGDGTPDASTETLLLSTTGPEYITSITEGEDGALYMLDRRCQDILVARDTNSDAWADSLQATPFALAQDFPDLLRGGYLVADGADQVRVYRMQPPTGQLGQMPYYVLVDSDSDGIADEIQAKLAPMAGTTAAPTPVR